ncbi:MAG: AI-2E family transporter, partial [Myxococcales bacterium]
MPARSQVRLSTMATILGSLAGAVLLGIVVWQVREILLWIFISFFLAIVLNPLADRLTQHMRRPLAVLSIAALGLSLLAVALLLLLPPLVRQLVELARQGPELARATLSTPWVQWLDRHFDLFARLEREAAAIPGYLAGAATPALKVAGGLAHALLAGVTIFFMTLFMIWGGAPLAMQLLEPFEPSTRARVLRLSRPIYQATTRYALGVAVIASIAGLVTMVTLAIMGVPWFLPIGVAVGLLSFIPFIGATVGGLVSFVVTWTTVG